MPPKKKATSTKSKSKAEPTKKVMPKKVDESEVEENDEEEKPSTAKTRGKAAPTRGKLIIIAFFFGLMENSRSVKF